MTPKITFLAILCLLVFVGCQHEELSTSDKELNKLISNKARYILPDETDYASIPQSPVNPLTKEKIELGKLLFFEPAFANEAKRQDLKFTFTCSSCHVPEAGFKPGRMQGIADGGVGFGRGGVGGRAVGPRGRAGFRRRRFSRQRFLPFPQGDFPGRRSSGPLDGPLR